MYSVEEASQILGLDASQVRRLLRSGEIKGKKLARDWVVLDLNYERKRKPKGWKSGMPTVKITMELNVGAGRKPSRSPKTEENLLLQLLAGGTMTVRELIEDLTFDGRIPKKLALGIIKGAISAGILQALL